MQRERVTESIYVFTSDLYVQVTASVVVTSHGAIVIDTLLYPEETQQIRQFVQDRLNLPIRYVINTHHHADHTLGTCLFEGAEIIAHRRCRELLNTRGRESLARMKHNAPDLANIEIVLPDVVFDDRLTIHLGNKTLQLWYTPGHSVDSIVCHLEDEQVLFGADTVMSIPHFVDGHFDSMLESLENLRGKPYETIIQGHGEVVLRGEVEQKLKEDISYLKKLQIAVDKALASATTSTKQEKALEAIKVEACGKNRILLNGAVQQLHRQNVRTLAKQRRSILLETE
jgi:glyoxylase-like metal-dependent hydrolase (beta-lactamase superfamily II)